MNMKKNRTSKKRITRGVEGVLEINEPRLSRRALLSLVSKPITFFLDQSGVEEEDVAIYLGMHLEEGVRDVASGKKTNIRKMLEAFLIAREKGTFVSWDLLASKYDVKPSQFIAAVTSGASLANMSTAKMTINMNIRGVVSKVAERAQGDGRSASLDAKLFAEMAGLTQDAPQVVVNTNQTNTTNMALIGGLPPRGVGSVLSEEELRGVHVRSVREAREARMLPESVEGGGVVIEGEVVETPILDPVKRDA